MLLTREQIEKVLRITCSKIRKNSFFFFPVFLRCGSVISCLTKISLPCPQGNVFWFKMTKRNLCS